MVLRLGMVFNLVSIFISIAAMAQAPQPQPLCSQIFAKTTRDEGMWLLNRLPKERIQANYDFKPTKAFVDHIMKASVRLSSGGSGAFVSSQGLLMTNHHVARETLQKLSTAQNDLTKNGFHAKSRNEEIPAPDLEVNQLQSIRSVTSLVLRGVDKAATPAEAQMRKRRNIAKIEGDAFKKTGLKSEVVELFLGAEYHLYQYKIFKDVRVVFAPEQQAVRFGGEEANFEYPRHSLDVTFLRVYENGRPFETSDFLKWSASGPKVGEPVIVAGQPGSTNRLFTMAAMKFMRDVQLPFILTNYKYRIARLEAYGKQSPEHKRQADGEALSLMNGFKVLSGEMRGLSDPDLFKVKESDEANLRAQSDSDAWSTIEQAIAVNRRSYHQRMLVSDGLAFPSSLFKIARHLIRQAAENEKPNAVRLPEYRDNRRESLEIELYSPSPIYKELEIFKLTDSLQNLSDNLGPRGDITKLVLAGETPAVRARQLVEGTHLDSIEARRVLAAGKLEGLLASKDPMIQLALAVDPVARELRENFEQQVQTPTQAGYAKIAQVRYKLFGRSEYPDATSTLRLAFGRVKGYELDGKQIPAWTFAQEALPLQDFRSDDTTLPASWRSENVDWGSEPIPFNFVSTADTIGGNSGSPVINREGEIVGINFDSNRTKIMKQRYLYTEGASRHVSVHSQGIVEILRRVYGATYVTDELGH